MNITFRSRTNKDRPTEHNKDAAEGNKPELYNVEDEDDVIDDGTVEVELIGLRKKGHKK